MGDGDKFVIELDLKHQFSNIYINERDEDNKICASNQEYTFDQLPDKFIFIYGIRSDQNSENETDSIVEVSLIKLKKKKHKKKKKKRTKEVYDIQINQEQKDEVVPEAETENNQQQETDDLDDDFDAMMNAEHDSNAQPI